MSLQSQINQLRATIQALIDNSKKFSDYNFLDVEGIDDVFLVEKNSNGEVFKIKLKDVIAQGISDIPGLTDFLDTKAELNGNELENFKVADAILQTEAITKAQLDSAISDLQGALLPQGNWNASTNTPNISATTETGYYWIVSVAGTTDIGGITDWEINDWAVKTATGWAKIDNTDKVASVAGKIGAVTLDLDDVSDSATRNALTTTTQTIEGAKTFSEDMLVDGTITFGESTHKAKINNNFLTAPRFFQFPNQTGTLALTIDINKTAIDNLGIDAEKLDGLNSTDFVRSTANVSQNISGNKTFTGELTLEKGISPKLTFKETIFNSEATLTATTEGSELKALVSSVGLKAPNITSTGEVVADTVTSNSFKSSDGSEGATITFNENGFEKVYKNGLLISRIPLP